MKFKSMVTLALLFVMSFSIVHEYIYALDDDKHCSPIEYVNEFSKPSSHGDICDIHYEYHSSYLLSQKVALQKIENTPAKISTCRVSYNFKNTLDFFKPPISHS
jgi:hypothetical protein